VSLDEHVPPSQGQQAYPAPQPQPGTSGLAIAGLILAFLMAPLGFILSLIALFKTGAGKRKGRGLAIAGLIVSVLIMAGGLTVGLLVANSTVVDPGCTAGKTAILDSANNADPKSLQGTVDSLNAAAAKAKHDDVRAATKALADDYAQMLKGMQSGKMPDGIVEKVGTDGAKFDSLCSLGN
jgi:hypothetical protein